MNEDISPEASEAAEALNALFEAFHPNIPPAESFEFALHPLFDAQTKELARLREENAVLKAQVENADINLEQVRMAQKGLWRTKLESAEARIAALEQQAREMEKVVAAAKRMSRGEYLAWGYAGGVNDCTHGYGEGIPCPKCDRALIDAAIAATNEGGSEG